VNIKGRTISHEILDLIPAKVARERNIIPIDKIDNKLIIAMGRPEDLVTIDDIALITGKKICISLSNPSDIEEAINLNYESVNQLNFKDAESEAAAEQAKEEIEEVIDFSPAAQNMNKIINQAVQDCASDIHMEPYKRKLRIRFRIDGVLQDKYTLPVSVKDTLMSRLKILGKMNIAEHRRPQDGQFTIKSGDKYVDIRVATAGTSHGERATLRILDKSVTLITLDKLGFLPDTLQQLKNMLRTSYGMVLAGGPTGSGKTTTLYSMINELNRQEMNIMTIEDPIEYNFSDITQMPVNEKSGITFSTLLKTTLRHDPDVILVGEIRDPETDKITVQAAMTGHLVLTSIHANDVASMIFRLIHLGIEPYLISSTLVGLVAQRLVRCVCQYCSKPIPPTPEEEKIYYEVMGEKLNDVHHGEGCSLCSNTGYRGRTGIFEVLNMNDTIRSKLMAGASASEIRHEAISNGMITMTQAGMAKEKMGISSLKDILRTIYTI